MTDGHVKCYVSNTIVGRHKYWMLQVIHVFRSVLCADTDNDPITHSDEDQTPKNYTGPWTLVDVCIFCNCSGKRSPLEYVNGHEYGLRFEYAIT